MASDSVFVSAVKFDANLKLQNFSWATNCTQPRIAIVALVKSVTRISQDNSTIIHFGGGLVDTMKASGVFTWRPDAVVNGTTTVSVLASKLTPASDPDDATDDDVSPVVSRAVFAFDAIKPSSVAWDPEMASLAGSSATIASAVASFFVAFLALLM